MKREREREKERKREREKERKREGEREREREIDRERRREVEGVGAGERGKGTGEERIERLRLLPTISPLWNSEWSSSRRRGAASVLAKSGNCEAAAGVRGCTYCTCDSSMASAAPPP